MHDPLPLETAHGARQVLRGDPEHAGELPLARWQLHFDLTAVRVYNDSIKLAEEVGDKATSDLLTKILKMEEGHVGWADVQRSQIEQMGIENYLADQTSGASE